LTHEPMSYRFGPIEHHGLLGPVRLGQAAVIGGALASAVGLLDAMGGIAGVVLAMIAIAASGTLATLPVAGRTGEQWMPVVCSFALRGTFGRRRFLSGAPVRGVIETSPDPSLPSTLRGVKLVTIEHGARRLGAFSEHHGRLLTQRPRSEGSRNGAACSLRRRRARSSAFSGSSAPRRLRATNLRAG
jgi:hypothetical protein